MYANRFPWVSLPLLILLNQRGRRRVASRMPPRRFRRDCRRTHAGQLQDEGPPEGWVDELHDLQPEGPREEVPEGEEAPVLAPDPPREPPPLRGRPLRHTAGHRGARDARREDAVGPRDRLPPRPRPPAGLHWRARRRRPCDDARGPRRDGRQH